MRQRGEMVKHSFPELVDVNKVQNLMDLFYKATGIPSSVLGLDGEIITGSGWQHICTDFHRMNPETRIDGESDRCSVSSIQKA
jgi:two-component system, cell cycle sensor histidine kinase and response regulator CckA